MKELRKTVGILGGMGPEATVEFMRRLIASVPATDDADHLHMLVDNNPKVPSRIKALIEKTGQSPVPALVRMAKGLEAAGAEFLAMPCNTTHAYLDEIRAAISIPVLDMIDLSVSALAELSPRPEVIGMLASPAVRGIGLFEAPLSRAGLKPLYPNPEEEEILLGLIRAVKAGKSGDAEQTAYSGIANALVRRGATALTVACTEFSLLPQPHILDVSTLDTLDVLVRETLKAARA